MGLSFCIVPLMGYVCIGDTVSLRHSAGVAMIIAGLIMTWG